MKRYFEVLMKSRLVLIKCLLLVSGMSLASKLEKAYRALEVYDYFKARQVFLKINKKSYDPYACYGLALIFSRNDNPFSNTDSAARYCNLANNLLSKQKKTFKTKNFDLGPLSIKSLADTIATLQLRKAEKMATVDAYNCFLQNNYLASEKLIRRAVNLRDELEYMQVLQFNQSDSTRAFMTTHPQSFFLREAAILLDRELFDEQTQNQTPSGYVAFLKKYPHNIMRNVAFEKLFELYRQKSDTKGLAYFVSDYTDAPQNPEAWKLLFSLSVKAYSYVELKRFVDEYPAFPLKNSILKELELNKLQLFPLQMGDFTGYVDTSGKLLIPPVYESGSDFSEGLAVVSRNDSVFYINKENEPQFGMYFQDAMMFRNGTAPVKENGRWHFINRLGQARAGNYDEVNEASCGVYVVRQNDRYGALDLYGQKMLECEYDKLGDFKNGFAYYTSNGVYGFVSDKGQVYKAEFEWISDFSEDEVAIVKQNNKYGLITGSGKKMLGAEYDLVVKAGETVYLVVNGTMYGFFDLGGCFITQIAYEYLKDKPVEFYTNGSFFRLLKKEAQTVIDANGHVVLGQGAYAEVNFPKGGLIRVKKKKRYGYLDLKQNISIPFSFDEAGDFTNGLAIVKVKDKYAVINPQGKTVLKSDKKIVWFEKKYICTSEEPFTLYDAAGTIVAEKVVASGRLQNGMLALSLESGEIKLIRD